jgi:predicted transglutaminase-like cysteine proteinase
VGFAPSGLLLCECIAPGGEHHMVLLVGDIALDNLTDELKPMRYPVVRVQSAANPDFWEKPST